MVGPQSQDTWGRGSCRERYVGRWRRRVAPTFVAWPDLSPGLHGVDAGCGSGAPRAAIADGGAPAALAGVDPSEGFLAAGGP